MYLIMDNGLFLKFSNLTQTGLETQCQLGTSCSSKVISRNRVAIAKKNLNVCSDAIKEAIEKYAITLMIDDYHNIHSIQTPTDEATSKVDDSCTIIIKIVKEATAIPLSSVNLIHNPSGTDINIFVKNFCSNQLFNLVSSHPFASSMLKLSCPSFDPVMGRHQIENMTIKLKIVILYVLSKMYI